MKYKIKIETAGYEEFVVEAGSLEEAEKNWSEFGQFQGDNCEEIIDPLFGRYSEHVGEPTIEKFEGKLTDDDGKKRKCDKDIIIQIKEFDGEYNTMVSIDEESKNVDIYEDNIRVENKEITISKVNKLLNKYLEE